MELSSGDDSLEDEGCYDILNCAPACSQETLREIIGEKNNAITLMSDEECVQCLDDLVGVALEDGMLEHLIDSSHSSPCAVS